MRRDTLLPPFSVVIHFFVSGTAIRKNILLKKLRIKERKCVKKWLVVNDKDFILQQFYSYINLLFKGKILG